MQTYIALLRGINVGGKNIIKMDDLKRCFEAMGFIDVTSYIQSGNIIFQSKQKDIKVLTKKIEEGLKTQFGVPIAVVLVSKSELIEVVKNAPKNFGKDHSKYRYDVLFLKDPLTSTEAMKDILTREGVDTVWKGKNVLYFSRLIAKATQSKLSRIVGMPVYKFMTIRNWNTTTKFLLIVEK